MRLRAAPSSRRSSTSQAGAESRPTVAFDRVDRILSDLQRPAQGAKVFMWRV